MKEKTVPDKFDISLLPLSEGRIRELPILSLAFLGDTVYDLYVRSYLVKHGFGGMERLHSLASRVVNARSQADASRLLAPIFTESETDVFRRGKNAKSAPPKNMSKEDYSAATGLESVIGYLNLKGDKDRTEELFRIIINHFFGEKNKDARG